MAFHRICLRLSSWATGLCLAVTPAVAQTPLAALGMIQRGLWELRSEGEPPQSVCLADPSALLQIRHKTQACSRLVIANQPASATIHYSCPGAGWGRTTVRVTTPRAAIIDTQGIADNAPFAFTAEARRTGPCVATAH